MRVVLDSNIFIFAFREKKTVCMRILENMDLFEVFIPSLILDEVVERLKTLVNKNFASKVRHTILSSSIHVVEVSTTPKTLIKKYEKKNLKTSDAVIAAFAEYIKADYLLSENRHFLKNLKTIKFRVKNAEQFLEMVGL